MVIKTKVLFPKLSLKQLQRIILSSLDDLKAVDVVSINLVGKSDIADLMIVASGNSARHIGSLAHSVVDALKKAGFPTVPVEGDDGCEWVLVDAGDVIVHLFKPEARSNYNIEKMWSASMPKVVEATYSL
jgi:ribosome-associated protein